MPEITGRMREVRPSPGGAAEAPPLNRLLLDLHDGSVQYVYAALLQLDLLDRDLDRVHGVGQEVRERVERTRRLLEDALGEVRSFIGALRPPGTETDDLPALLRSVAREHQGRTGTQVEVIVKSEPPNVSLPVRVALYRVLQEALSNAHRHSGANHVTIRLAVTGRRRMAGLRLTITDDGVGFTPGAADSGPHFGRHFGLQGMRERIEALGGSFRVTSRPGEGTAIMVALALR
ncbi:MAG TPA: ATP-binding protein [Longimicrobiaceae bacterium]|nr:ATP-binding protein [Longimicrobiaceae bacterium]